MIEKETSYRLVCDVCAKEKIVRNLYDEDEWSWDLEERRAHCHEHSINRLITNLNKKIDKKEKISEKLESASNKKEIEMLRKGFNACIDKISQIMDEDEYSRWARENIVEDIILEEQENA